MGLALLLGLASSAGAYITDQAAVAALGQQSMTFAGANGTQGTAATGLFSPTGAWSDGTMLIVADTANNRVLIYDTVPASNGVPADVVVGQTDMNSSVANQGGSPAANTLSGPTGVYYDGSSLYIADKGNNRVLIFVNLPTSNNASADWVVGQSAFTTGSAGATSATSLKSPAAVYADGASLYVADQGNNRIAIYTPVPASNGAAASVVVGQTGMSGSAVNAGTTVKAYTLSAPASVLTNGTTMYVADQGNNRVLLYNPIPAVIGSSATTVVGQAAFTSNSANQGGAAGARTLSSPAAVYTNGASMAVADFGNNRVLMYSAVPLVNNTMASYVVGQTTMSAVSANQGLAAPTANTLSRPTGVFSDGTQLYVVDQSNNRALIYNPIPASNNNAAGVAVGQSDLKTGTGNQASSISGANTLNRPSSVYTDRSKLYVADRFNNRVLLYNAYPAASNASASIVVGQVLMSSNSANQGGAISSATLSNPSAAYSDGTRLYVSDQSNSRVLIYNSIPAANGASANVVLGQPTSTTGNANHGGITANSLSFPGGVFTVGATLIVADRSNNRVLLYHGIPGADFAAADTVLGQTAFTAGTANPGGVSAKTLNNPSGVYSDGTLLYVADQLNNRVLVFPAIPAAGANDPSATIVLGQANMTSNSANQGAAAAANNTLSSPNAVYGDGTYLYVADQGNNRVLAYALPVSNNAAAAFVVGQSSFNLRSSNMGASVSAQSLGNPTAVVVDSTTGRMFIADSNNNRAVMFMSAVTSPLGQAGGTVSLPTPVSPLLVQAQVPPNAFSQSFNLSLYALPSFPTAPAVSASLRPTGIGFQLNTDLGLQPAINSTLQVTYKPADVAGFDASRLVLARYDDAGGVWVSLPSISDTANSRVIAQTNHFSTFQLFQADASANSVSQATVYPNPFLPSQGQMAMVFASFPVGARIRIYTISGVLVRDMTTDSAGVARWDGTNDAGARVASGVYYAYAQGNGKKRIFTVAIQR